MHPELKTIWKCTYTVRESGQSFTYFTIQCIVGEQSMKGVTKYSVTVLYTNKTL